MKLSLPSFPDLWKPATARHRRARRGFWWCCCSGSGLGSGGGSEGGSGIAASQCTACVTERFPLRMQIDISGVSADICLDCPGLDGTYITNIPGPCTNVLSNIGTLCGLQSSVTVMVDFNIPTAKYRLTVSINNGLRGMNWQHTQDTPIDCMNLMAFSVPPSPAINSCDITGSTCLVTALTP